jgi:hypothetical protein
MCVSVYHEAAPQQQHSEKSIRHSRRAMWKIKEERKNNSADIQWFVIPLFLLRYYTLLFLLLMGISLIFLQFMTGKNIDEKECFGKKSMKIFDLEKRFCNLWLGELNFGTILKWWIFLLLLTWMTFLTFRNSI